MSLGEGAGRTVGITAAPYSFGPIQPDRTTMSWCVMQAHHASAVADSHDPTHRAPSKYLVGFNSDDLLTGSVFHGNDVDAWNIQESVGTRAPPAAGSSISHVRVSCEGFS